MRKTRPVQAQGSAMAMAGFSGAALSILAELASRKVELPVFDTHGTVGTTGWGHSISLQIPIWVSGVRLACQVGAPAVSSDQDLVSFATALQEQLGLKLEATRGPVDVMVIDAVRQPTEN